MEMNQSTDAEHGGFSDGAETMHVPDPALLPPLQLPRGITSRFIDTAPLGIKFHVLESMPSNVDTRPPLVLLVHGFPNLAYDWRFVMPQLAAAGYYVVAFDQRGFGRSHDASLRPLLPQTFRPTVMIRDVVLLVHALGYTSVHTMVGHDLGAVTTACCALARDDMVRSVVLMSHPFGGAPKIPLGAHSSPTLPRMPPPVREGDSAKDPDIHSSLLKLQPPRKHYKWYNASSNAHVEWSFPQGRPLHDFLRGYFHLKSADHGGATPRELNSWTADELAIMPHYYVMRAGHTMRENVSMDMSQEPQEVIERLSSTPWLPESDLEVYTTEWSRTTFRDALRWYKVFTEPEFAEELQVFAYKKIRVPTKFVSGAQDWGNYQVPGALNAMEKGESVESMSYLGTVLIEGAGHWVHMEQPAACVQEILNIASAV